jgi:hypothetical protein
MNEFDKWRRDYEALSFSDQVIYHNDLERRYPEQNHFNYELVKSALQLIENPVVLEFGTWKGDLALKAFNDFNIKHWWGIEICQSAINKTKCSKVKYIMPDRFDWFTDERNIEADIIIATHFIEHLSNTHFKQIAEYCKGVPIVHFESPLSKEGNEWNGYEGTHKLTYGWDKVESIMLSIGYRLMYSYPEAKTFIYEY